MKLFEGISQYVKEPIILNDPSKVYERYGESMSKLDREYLVALLLNSKKMLIKEEIVSVGTLNCSLIHPREVFKSAIINSAHSIILVHNHPSGDCEPSEEDVQVTKALSGVGEMLGIRLLDHVIIGNGCYGNLLLPQAK